MDLEVLLERDVVLSALSELLDGVGGGIAATVFLVAGAGLGKSSLVGLGGSAGASTRPGHRAGRWRRDGVRAGVRVA
jgi:hypothetical protein